MILFLGLSSNVFLILYNINPVVGITCMGHGCECGIYVWLTITNIRTGKNYSVVEVVGLNLWWKG